MLLEKVRKKVARDLAGRIDAALGFLADFRLMLQNLRDILGKLLGGIVEIGRAHV